MLTAAQALHLTCPEGHGAAPSDPTKSIRAATGSSNARILKLTRKPKPFAGKNDKGDTTRTCEDDTKKEWTRWEMPYELTKRGVSLRFFPFVV